LAIESALEHVDCGNLQSTVTINFIFVESNKNHAAHLRDIIAGISLPSQFNINIIEGEFRDRVASILDHLESGNKALAPTFAFVDPFGFKGIPMSLMARILRFPRCEVLVNIMVDFINRFLEHPNDSVTEHIPETFGTSAVFDIPKHSGSRLEHILRLYRAQLKKYGDYVGRFDMHGRKDRKAYSLFFATNSPKGFEKMKEAMWAVDKYTGNKFSDADPNPVSLFESWGYESLWDELLKEYAGNTVPMFELETFVIERTDFLPPHARKILAQHEKLGHILVEALPNCKRRGKSFPKDKVQIAFPESRERF
jgi:three-Cys-motif partner protein